MSQERKAQLEASLTNHTPAPGTIEEIEAIRGIAKTLGGYIIDHCPESRETSIALTELESSVMWAVKSLVLPREESEVCRCGTTRASHSVSYHKDRGEGEAR